MSPNEACPQGLSWELQEYSINLRCLREGMVVTRSNREHFMVHGGYPPREIQAREVPYILESPGAAARMSMDIVWLELLYHPSLATQKTHLVDPLDIHSD
jgi:hypothetical protein